MNPFIFINTDSAWLHNYDLDYLLGINKAGVYYFADDCYNKPAQIIGAIMVLSFKDSGFTAQIVFDFSGNNWYGRSYHPTGGWRAWKPLL